MAKILNGYDLSQRTPTPINYFVEGLIPLGVTGDVFAPPDCGKTTMLLSLISATANGEKAWFGRQIATGRVVVIGGEKSDESVWTRDLHRCGRIENPEGLTIIEPEGSLWKWSGSEWQETKEYKEILAVVKSIGPVLTVIDTISRVSLGSDPINYSQQVLLARKVEEFQKEIGGTLLTVSHTNQASANEELSMRLNYMARSGGNGYPGWLRWLMGMTNLTQKEKEVRGLDVKSKIIALAVSKHNEMPQPDIGNRFEPLLFEIRPDGGLVMIANNYVNSTASTNKKGKSYAKQIQQKPF